MIAEIASRAVAGSERWVSQISYSRNPLDIYYYYYGDNVSILTLLSQLFNITNLTGVYDEK